MSKSPLIEDIAKLASNAAAVVFENVKDAGENLKSKVKDATGGFKAGSGDYVTREEFDVVREIAQKALQKVEELEKKLAAK